MAEPIDFVPVLLGAEASAYGMARSFYEGCRVASQAVAMRTAPICESSAFVSIATLDPDFGDDDGFVRILQQVADQPALAGRPLLLVPTENSFTRLLVRHADELAESYRFAVPDQTIIEQVATKDRFYRTAERLGLPVLPYRVITPGASPDDQDFPFPAVLKPDDPDAFAAFSYRGKKNAYEIRTRAELALALSSASHAGFEGAMILQQICAGAADALHTITCYRDAQGAVRLYCQGDVILELASPWGIGHFGAVVAGFDAAVKEQVEALLAALDYRGFCNIDVKIDAKTGTPYLLDFNVAPCDTSFLATVAGANLARVLVADVFGQEPGTSSPVQADEALLTQIPVSTIRQYARRLAVWSRVEPFIRDKRIVELFNPIYDQNFKRWKAYRSDQHFHRREFADCLGRNHVND